MKIRDLIRPNILALQPYRSARHEFEGLADVYLDANENPYGAAYSRYPDPLQIDLKDKIASNRGIRSTQIFLGNGSDEAIDILIRIFCVPGQDEILTLPPTYGMYRVCADIADVKVNESLLSLEFQPQLEDIKEKSTAHTKLLFICTPNNPTGNNIEPASIRSILESFEGIVVVDEAYVDFSPGSSSVQLLDEYSNLVILQTFSKAWGLAGIRLGLAFASEEIIQFMNNVKPPYNINVLTQREGLRALIENEENKRNQVDEIIAERTNLAKRLEQHKAVKKVFPSEANFLLVRFDNPIRVFDLLKSRGIVVRDRSKTPLCEGCLRITVGTPDENKLVIDTLNQLS